VNGVFGRTVGYDPRDDNIVRSHASRLRQRLDSYFAKKQSMRSCASRFRVEVMYLCLSESSRVLPKIGLPDVLYQ